MENILVHEGVVELSITRFITIDDVIENINGYVDRSNALPSKQLIIIDASRCRTNISLSDLTRLKDSNKLLCERFELLKVAIILNDPVYTALCMIYQNLINSDGYDLKVFSTRGAAHRWLKY